MNNVYFIIVNVKLFLCGKAVVVKIDLKLLRCIYTMQWHRVKSQHKYKNEWNIQKTQTLWYSLENGQQ